ncbi:MAG: carboxypeptidase-like regulatory domain-containing protein [bacterium]|nr:carboxypeptidase-like regulatory domain-containing protein [bacterium]
MHYVTRAGLFAVLSVGLSVALAPAQQIAPLVGVVTGPDGELVAGARVTATRFAGQGYELLDLDFRYRRTPAGAMPTTRRGRFALQLPLGVPVQLVVDAPGFARWLRDDVMPGSELAIRLAAPATLRGSVRLPGGAGAPATMRVWDRNRCKYVEAGRTRADGTFEFARLPAGPVTVSVHPDAAASPRWQKVELRAGEVTELSVDVKPGRVLKGRVLDEAGKAVPGAVIGEGWTMRRRVVAGDDGVFAFPGFAVNTYGELLCRAQGFVGEVVQQAELKNAKSHEFVLARGGVVRGRLLNAAGEPLRDTYVAAVSMDGEPHTWVPGRTDAEGRFSLGGIPTRVRPVLFVKRLGLATSVWFVPKFEADRVDLGEVTVAQSRVVQGTLLDAGEPVADSELTLRGCNADCDRFAGQPAVWSLTRRYVARRTVRTNRHGQFAFGDLPPGSYSLRQAGEELAVVEVGPEDPVALRVDLAR